MSIEPLTDDRTHAGDWRRHGAFYQIYPRSFADSNGDGIGDIQGIVGRLPHLASLGLQGLWVSPWFPSPFRDGGYDVADYDGVHPWFGTLDDAGELFRRAGDAGIHVLFDLVANHTSRDHPWFREAMAAEKGSAARRRYHFVEGRGPTGDVPPNDWQSGFGGPAWSRTEDGQWYLHLFDAAQPDLNWSEESVHEEFRGIIRRWIERGASGFRADVAHALAKDPAYPAWTDVPGAHEIPPGVVHPTRDRDELHEIIRDWRRVLDEGDRELVMVAEAVVSPWSRLSKFLRPDEYHQVFDFLFLEAPWDRDAMRAVIDDSLSATTSVGALPTWVLSNHDVVRHVTRYSLPQDVHAAGWLLDGDRSLLDEERGRARGRAAAMMAMALPGAYFMFQGEELGLPEAYDLPADVLDDPIWERSGRTLKGRDGCRVPIPWRRDGVSLGFGESDAWLPQPRGWGDLSVAAQDGVAGSTLELYRSCLRLRAAELHHDDVEWVATPGLLGFRRRDVLCVVNLGDDAVAVPDGDVLAASSPPVDGRLAADGAAWIRIR